MPAPLLPGAWTSLHVHVILLSHAHGDHIGKPQGQLALTRERVINLKQCLPRPIQTRPRILAVAKNSAVMTPRSDDYFS